MPAPDEGKLTDRVCGVVDERTYLDLNRHLARIDMSQSEFIRWIVRRELYGSMVAAVIERVDAQR